MLINYHVSHLSLFPSAIAGQPHSDGDQHHTRVPPRLSQLHVQTTFQSAAWFQ